jgi:hypothetical protein
MDSLTSGPPVQDSAARLKRVTASLGAEALTAVRKSVASYVLAAGVEHTPTADRLARRCVDEAVTRLSAKGTCKTAVLHDEALKIAGEHCGIVSGFGRSAAEKYGQAKLTEATATIASIAAGSEVVPCVPAEQRRSMPPQPLGELLPALDARWWTRLAWRPFAGFAARCYESLAARRK